MSVDDSNAANGSELVHPALRCAGTDAPSGPESVEMLCTHLLTLVSSEDVLTTMSCQHRMLHRFEKSNAMLSNFNELSEAKMNGFGEEIKDATVQLQIMKKDLDNIFKRVRLLRAEVLKQYPSPPDAVDRSTTVTSNEHDCKLQTDVPEELS